MLQPIAGYVLDVIGLKLGFAIFAVAWSFITMAHGLAEQLDGAFLAARPAGARRGLGQPRGDEGDVGVVPRKGARARRRRLQHRRVLRVDARAAPRGVGHHRLQLAGSLRPDRRARPRVGRAVVVALRVAREACGPLSGGAASHRLRAGATPSERRNTALGPKDSRAAELLGDRAAEVSRRSDVGHAHVLAAALSRERPGLRPETDCAVRLVAIPCGRYRLPVWRHDQPVAPETLRHEPDQCPRGARLPSERS